MTEKIVASTFNAALAEPLVKACSEGRLKDVQLLLDSGADPNAAFEEAGRGGIRKVFPITATFRVLALGDSLPKMAQRQTERLIDLLVTSGASVRQVDREVLMHSIRMGMPQMLDFLVNHGARIQRYAHELMELSILQNKIECIKQLKILGIDPDIKDQWGSTVFLNICSGKIKIYINDVALYNDNPSKWFKLKIDELVSVGVNINNIDQIGATPLMRSILMQQEIIMNALLDAGADIRVIMRNGVGAVHLAAASGSLDCLEKVMDHVSDRTHIHRLANQMKSLRLRPDIKAHLSRMSYM